jgi:membrane-bound metal-dependent hydrolase YbcI (DUF457 family)
MFIGHIAVGLAAKRLTPKTSLGTLLISVQCLDLVWPVMLLLGLEHVRIDPGNTVVTPLDFYDYPITHSLLGAAAWSLVLAGIYWLARRERRAAFVIGAGVLSHWILDAISHRPDLLLIPGGQIKVGLGLWNCLPATLLVEGSLFLAGIALFLRTSEARDGIGRYGFGILMAVFLALYLGALFGPPPPNPQALAWVSLATWLFVPLLYWIDRHRQTIQTQ